MLHALIVEPVRELRRAGGNLVKAQNLVNRDAVGIRGMGDPHRRATRAVSVAGNRFVRDVEMFPVAVKQVPQRIGRRPRLRIGIAGKICESRHGSCLSHKILVIVNSE